METHVYPTAFFYPRFINRAYAFFGGYFWLPCPSCGRKFGGHEISYGPGTSMRAGDGTARCVCPRCVGAPGTAWEQFSDLPADFKALHHAKFAQLFDGKKLQA